MGCVAGASDLLYVERVHLACRYRPGTERPIMTKDLGRSPRQREPSKPDAAARPTISTRRLRAWSRLLLTVGALVVLLQCLLAGTTLSDDKDAWAFKHALLVTAHPDDEAMFFAPAILALIRRGIQVDGLCLSNGNAANLGAVRAGELNKSYQVLGVESDRVTLIDDPAFTDGMDIEWDREKVVGAIERQWQSSLSLPYDAILTFDKGGITHHANHVACAEAVEAIVRTERLSSLQAAYSVRTIPILHKFLSLPGALVRFGYARWTTPSAIQRQPPASIAFLSSPVDYVRALHAMAKHQSQLVWFRYLYVLFSGYMFGIQLDVIT